MGNEGAGCVFVVISLAIYLVPSFVAYGRGQNNAGAILALNLLLGWTLIGWVAALVWSLTSQGVSAPIAPVVKGGADRAAEIERYAALHQKGILTSEEFAEIKAKLLARGD